MGTVDANKLVVKTGARHKLDVVQICICVK